MGIRPEAQAEEEAGNWWDREDSSFPGSDSVPMTLGQQAELFDESGHAAFSPAERISLPIAEARPVAQAIPQTIVSVQSKSRTTARVIATTRVAAPTRVTSVSKTATAGRGDVARKLMMSQSISSGREESRWFSVPQRVLLPRYQLFEGADAVTEDSSGLRIGSPSMRTQRGRVWFV